MPGKLKEEIHQQKPFVSAAEEAYLNLVRTADALTRDLDRILQPHGLTSTQYNVLRILRGAGEAGATCSGVSDRLLAYDPDVTRLLDRLEKAALVRRERSTKDRRVVMAFITDVGLQILTKLDQPLEALLERQFRPLKKERIAQLIEDLEQLRSGVEPS
ncbi:MAG TPA: MarR family transcriptional regulator [Thermoanaerobaculia bacterium]|jgi:DNA-binding MarR family transcriptional regulator